MVKFLKYTNTNRGVKHFNFLEVLNPQLLTDVYTAEKFTSPVTEKYFARMRI